jgi:hypothetical protein
MDKAPFEVVTKLEAAERQLRVAIRLFFERRDFIAVHTLAAAAQEVVRDLAKPRRLKGIYEYAAELVRPEFKKEFIETMRGPQNFFKHADKDANQALKFHYGATEFILFDGVWLCTLLKDQALPPEFLVFGGWFMVKHPGVFSDDGKGIISAAYQLAQGLDFDNYELLISAIDTFSQYKDSK